MLAVALTPLRNPLTGGLHREPPEFDGARAFAHLEAQCRLGPRVPGTDAHLAGRRYVESELRRETSDVQVYPCAGPGGWGGELHGWNLVARFGRGGSPLLIGAHWD